MLALDIFSDDKEKEKKSGMKKVKTWHIVTIYVNTCIHYCGRQKMKKIQNVA